MPLLWQGIYCNIPLGGHSDIFECKHSTDITAWLTTFLIIQEMGVTTWPPHSYTTSPWVRRVPAQTGRKGLDLPAPLAMTSGVAEEGARYTPPTYLETTIPPPPLGPGLQGDVTRHLVHVWTRLVSGRGGDGVLYCWTWTSGLATDLLHSLGACNQCAITEVGVDTYVNPPWTGL